MAEQKEPVKQNNPLTDEEVLAICRADYETAKGQLAGGDFHIYYSEKS